MTDRTMTIREAARRLAVSENTIRAWVDKGLLTNVKVPGSAFRRLSVMQVEQLAASRLAAQNAAVKRPKGGIEAARRALRNNDPNLYEYIEALAVSRALQQAGSAIDSAPSVHAAATAVWALAAAWGTRKDDARAKDESEHRK